ncbi:DUF6225 family protein [Streptomyces sp. NPDC057908]|uniref:DUF6225 family protein n=1 Tax=Streptomyces sp. NPDC057908 TaxID=3346276 RepID=UPI0036E58A32
MADTFDHAPSAWNAAQLREAIKNLPDDAPIRIGVADDPGTFDCHATYVLVDAEHVETWRPPSRRARAMPW